MECRKGYKHDSPLCAVCDKGYYRHMSGCSKCDDGVRYTELLLFLLGLLFAVAGIVHLTLKYWRLLAHVTVMAHAKILVSFVVVLLSVDVQFGVSWPPMFARLLDALAVLTFDLGFFSGIFCLVELGAFN